MQFKSQDPDDHIRQEEDIWAKILSKGDPKTGMILIYDQKLCAIAHEFEQFMKNSAKIDTAFAIARLRQRLDQLLTFIKDLDSAKEFRDIKADLEMYVFKDLPEVIHQASHKLVDELKAKQGI